MEKIEALIPMEMGGRQMPESILVEIVARLPLRSIARFKSVSKTLKSVIESSYFRRLFVSLHRNSYSSWSLIFGANHHYPITEAISFHGCETWNLPKSLVSYIMLPNLLTSKYFYVASSNGLIWINVFFTRTHDMPYSYKSFVGNPVLQQWVEIPPPPDHCIATGLVTRVENGVVSGFKVVRTCQKSQSFEPIENGMYVWRVYVYSSDTGLWTFKRLLSSHPVNYIGSYPPVNLDGMLYLHERGLDRNEPGALVAHDFYGPEDDYQCRVIPLPPLYKQNVKRCLTTSRGDVFYIEMMRPILKIWRLTNNNYSEISEWLQSEDINMASDGFDVDCFHMGMNPLDTDIFYLWSYNHQCLVTGNLQKQEFIVHQESENWSNSEGCWRINTSDSKAYVESNFNGSTVVMLSPFVLQPWIDSVPCPPN